MGGAENARHVRDELITRAEEYLIESEKEIERSPADLAAATEESRKRANRSISSGEFILAVLFGVVGFYLSGWLVFGISIVIALSASLRVTTVDSLAISSPDDSRSQEWLLAAFGWNRGAIEGGKILFNTACAVWMWEYDERAFEVFIEDVFIPSLEQGGISMSQAVRTTAPKLLDIAGEET